MMFRKSEKQIEREGLNKAIFFGILIGLASSIMMAILKKPLIVSIIVFFAFPVLFFLFFYFRNRLRESARIKKMEFIFPDFLQLMSSNLRAGITIDKSMLLSVRNEFYPLDKEIEKTGRDITTGKDIELALLDMSKRIGSEKIRKTILLIISGIKVGGDIAVLLEETSVNMRERSFVEKRAASNVLMYVIFIFLAVSIGAPALFSLSIILVEVLTNLLSGLPDVGASTTTMAFTLSKINISPDFIKYFSLVFIIITNILAALILGLVSKGEEKEGLKYVIPIIAISMTVFFTLRLVLSGYLAGLFG